MRNVYFLRYAYLIVGISGTWGGSFVFVNLITDSMHPRAAAASRGFTAMSARFVWLALRRRAPPVKPAPGTDHEKSASRRWINDRSGDPVCGRDCDDPPPLVAR